MPKSCKGFTIQMKIQTHKKPLQTSQYNRQVSCSLLLHCDAASPVYLCPLQKQSHGWDATSSVDAGQALVGEDFNLFSAALPPL